MKNYQDKTWLKKKYLDEKLSTIKIAELCGLHSHVSILNLLKKFKIKRRTLSEAKQIYHPRGMLGKHHSEETKKRIKETSIGRGKGRKLADSTKRKISDIKKKAGYWVGKNNPNYKPKIEKTCAYCGGNFQTVLSRKDKAVYCSMKCRNLADTGKPSWNKGLTAEIDPRIAGGEKNGRWCGGKSFEPYGLEFNNKLKAQIRARDNNQCQLCRIYEKSKAHHVHHIDYCKKNNRSENLITLCVSCHSKTSGDRDYWIKTFEEIIR